jgi:hypothetical protein
MVEEYNLLVIAMARSSRQSDNQPTEELAG